MFFEKQVADRISRSSLVEAEPRGLSLRQYSDSALAVVDEITLFLSTGATLIVDNAGGVWNRKAGPTLPDGLSKRVIAGSNANMVLSAARRSSEDRGLAASMYAASPPWPGSIGSSINRTSWDYFGGGSYAGWRNSLGHHIVTTDGRTGALQYLFLSNDELASNVAWSGPTPMNLTDDAPPAGYSLLGRASIGAADGWLLYAQLSMMDGSDIRIAVIEATCPNLANVDWTQRRVVETLSVPMSLLDGSGGNMFATDAGTFYADLGQGMIAASYDYAKRIAWMGVDSSDPNNVVYVLNVANLEDSARPKDAFALSRPVGAIGEISEVFVG